MLSSQVSYVAENVSGLRRPGIFNVVERRGSGFTFVLTLVIAQVCLNKGL